MVEAKRLEMSAVANDEACAHVDDIDVHVSAGESCVVLEIGCGLPGAKVMPVLLSAAASRELAANLMKAADKLEPRD